MNDEHPVGGPMLRAAALAVEQLNRAGGLEGVPFELVTRWDEDPWKGGSKQVVKLVYEDSVWAVIGSIDGGATHVAEQVITKAWLPLLSPISSDPTLTYIRIPWMFRLPPDDERQAEVLARDGILAESLTRVGVITSSDHDGRVFATEMLESMQAHRLTPAFHLQLPSHTDIAAVLERAMSFDPDGIVVRVAPPAVLALSRHLGREGADVALLMPWVPGLELDQVRNLYGGRILQVQPFSTTDNPDYDHLTATYEARYGHHPTPIDAYVYDAVHLLAQSLEESGLNRSQLRDAIADRSGYLGVTGVISWDNAGGNTAQPVLRILPRVPRGTRP
jgi:branched-chain amino acid transport system substrate-binding protein